MINLPISDVLPALREALALRNEAVLEAPPGAGKTTLVPLALLDAPWLKGRKILMLEPRRLAARAAAERMAQLLGEPVGKTVGYRVRLESRVSADTRIEVVTEGILGRMLQDDPSLDEIGLLIFDEFHERSLDADLGLALALEGRRLFFDLRDASLKILLMSATLDGQRLAELLNQAPVIRSEGRQFPVTLCYGASRRLDEPLIPLVVTTVLKALHEHEGNILVFLPGQGEIRQCQQQLAERVDPWVILAPLYGNLSLTEQRIAIAAPPPGQCKVVLATAIAESSLTIEGITVVVDSGLQRLPAFDPRTGMTRLHTRRVSQASATQRAGRAGRLQPGFCYRLWSEAQQRELAPFAEAEICQADLSSLALQVLQWGVDEINSLQWLDPPPNGAYRQALDLLASLGALEEGDKPRLSLHGEAMASLPLHPRLSHMLLCARAWRAEALACEIAAVLSERDPLFGQGADLSRRLALFKSGGKGRDQGVATRLVKLKNQFLKTLSAAADSGLKFDDPISPGVLLAHAYPDRVARQRDGRSGEYQLSNGRGASLRQDDSLQGENWLVVADLGGRAEASSDVVGLAATLDQADFDGPLKWLCQDEIVAQWSDEDERFIAQQRCRVGQLILRSQRLPSLPVEEKQRALLAMIRQRGLGVLALSEASRQLCARVELLRNLPGDGEHWPDFSNEGLLASLPLWLGPYLDPVRNLRDLQQLDCHSLLLNRLEWSQRQYLDAQAPETISVPSGNRHRIDYGQNPPVLAVKLQEMFGCCDTPRIAEGRVALTLHLLSPARRPLQITQDLAGFWQGSYQQVKKEMKGRYPKHPWPDDPAAAVATAKTKRASGQG